MTRLFLDANVLFTAAHNPEGKASFIISLSAQGAWEICTSVFAVEEARRNLGEKYPCAEKKLNELLVGMMVVQEPADASLYLRGLPEKVRPIFQAAHMCHVSHLITGDPAHFGTFMEKPEKTSGIIILTPARFLSSL